MREIYWNRMKYEHLFTPVRIEQINQIDSFKHQFGFIGSCFSDHMFQRFRHHGLGAWISPFGTTYNPISIVNQLLASLDLVNDFNLTTQGGQYFYWETSHKISAQSPEELKGSVVKMRLASKLALQNMDTLFITLGSAWAYELKATGLIVANCHKIPATSFSKRLLGITEITDALHELFTRLKQINPFLNIVLTVSPVKHLRDGIVENSRSKARLIEACHSMAESSLGCYYFPAYEILVDELRDYRFYEKDGAHPTEFAIDIVFNALKTAIFTSNLEAVLVEIDRIRHMEQHRFTAQSNAADIEKHQGLIESSKMRLNAHYEIQW